MKAQEKKLKDTRRMKVKAKVLGMSKGSETVGEQVIAVSNGSSGKTQTGVRITVIGNSRSVRQLQCKIGFQPAREQVVPEGPASV